ncbi:MAG TPA: glycosyltransferase family A protein [Candidatus Dormibacteraeota bacterium]|nr:glycosyltransferase family A protein [Candidatus Dormibacteraeota bacterium]
MIRSHPESPAPLVSVVVSTRNHARTLQNTIDGVMRQDIQAPIELIIVDDASTDPTPAVLRENVARAPRPLVYARLPRQQGPAGGRNAGLNLARGRFIAFTDSDCTPEPQWLRKAVEGFAEAGVGIVQGRTEAASDRPPFFAHYIVTTKLDGSYSTSNVIYRREALGDLRFDPACTYNHNGRPDSRFFWEDVDLGWRVLATGWSARFAEEAVVRHEVIPLRPRQWVMWPEHYALMPAKVARFPGFRRHLFLRTWVSPLNFWFDVALLGVIAAPFLPLTLLLVLPYGVEFIRNRGIGGSFPPAKVAMYLAWDAVALWSLAGSSLRNRALVL